MLALVLAIAFFAVGAAAADATTRFVATGGTDSGNCDPGPCLTVQYAIDQAVADDTINIGPGTFTGNVNVNKKLTVDGAGSGPGGTAIAGGLTVSASGASTVDPLIVRQLSVSNSAPAGDGVLIGAGFDFVTIQDVATVGNASEGIEIAGGALTEDLILDAVKVNSNGAVGIRMGGAANVRGLSLINSEVRLNGSIGFSYNSSISAIGLDDVLIEDTVFEKNSNVVKTVGSGDVSFFNFNGDATVRDVDIIGHAAPDQGAHIGLQFRGSNTPTAAGTVALDNVSITGSYQRPGPPSVTPGLGLVLANYTSLSTFTMSDVDVNLTVGHALNVFGLTPTLDIGNTFLQASDPASAAILVGTSAQNNVRSNVDATDATIQGVLLSGATEAQLLTVSNKIVDRLLNDALGLVTLRSGKIPVTQDKGAGAVQRAVNAATSGTDILLGDGTFVGGVNVVGKSITIKGTGRTNTTTITAPNTPLVPCDPDAGFRGVICVFNSNSVTVRDVIVDGANTVNLNQPTNNDPKFAGIAFPRSGGLISNVEVTNMQRTPLGSNGIAGGVGISQRNNVTGTTADVPRRLRIHNSLIHNFQRNGLALDDGFSGATPNYNGALTATVTDTVIDGQTGPLTDAPLARNGIVTDNGAKLTVTDSTLRDFVWDGPGSPADIATGIVLYDTRDVTIEDNVFENSQVGIYNLANQFPVAGVPENSVAIAGNSFSGTMPNSPSNTSYGIIGLYGSSYSITGNEITATSVNGQQEGINIQGGNPFVSAVIRGNTIVDQGVGIRASASPNAVNSLDLTASSNRIAGNDVGIRNDSSDPVMARNNWWGCDLGADQPPLGDCGDDIVGEDVSTGSPLQLRLSATPATIYSNNDQSLISATLVRSSGQIETTIRPSEIAFGSSLGTVSPLTDRTQQGKANSVLTSNNVIGTANVTATLDSEVKTTPVLIQLAPDGPTGSTGATGNTGSTGSTGPTGPGVNQNAPVVARVGAKQVTVPSNRRITGARVRCVEGNCRIRQVQVRFNIGNKVFNGVPRSSKKRFAAGRTVLVRTLMPKRLYQLLQRDRVRGTVTFAVTAASDNGTRTVTSVRIGLKR